MVKAEKMAGVKIGNMVVIGDTGKRSKRGDVIVLTVDEDGFYHEVLSGNLFHKPESYSGWVGSEKHIKIASEVGRKNIKTAHDKLFKEGSKLDNISDGLSNKNRTGYAGIRWNYQNKMWQYDFTFQGKRYRKSFNDFNKTVLKRNELVLEICNPYLKKHNFPLIEKIDEKSIIKNDYVKSKDKLIKNKNNKSVKENKQSFSNGETIYGYYFCKSRCKFRVYAQNGSKKKYFGQFNSEEEAINRVRQITPK